MTVGVVVSCYQQERFLARTLAALERALEGREWQGVLELAVPSNVPLPPLSPRWKVVCAFDPATGRPGRPLTPGGGRMRGLIECAGEWVLFADSDVEVDPAWVHAALETAAREPHLAGVFGRLEEWFVDGDSVRPGLRDMYRTGDTDRPVEFLAALALYRREALEAVGGYDVRLHSDEDFELGLRLRQAGFEMRSLGRLGAKHWSAPRPTFRELARRWSTGICFGPGQSLRMYLGRPGFLAVLRRQWLYLATLALWMLGVAAAIAALVSADSRWLAAWAALPLAVLALMALRKRSPRLGLLSLSTWSMHGAGLLVGLFRVPPGARPLPRARGARC